MNALARLRVMLLYPALVCGVAVAFALWIHSGSPDERAGRGLGASWVLAIGFFGTLPGYLLGVFVLHERILSLAPWRRIAIAVCSASLTPPLAFGAWVLTGRLGFRHRDLTDALAVGGTLFAGTLAVALSYLAVARAPAGRRRA